MPLPGMDEDDSAKKYLADRRRFMKILGVGAAAGLAGCTDGGGGTETTTEGEMTETTTTTTPTTTTTTPDQIPDRSGQYVEAYSSAAQTLNWVYNQEAGTAARIGLTLDGPYTTRQTQDGAEIFPLWMNMTTEDGKTWTCELREGLQWGKDYGQMTAEDWVFMIKNIFQGKNNWAAYPSAGDWTGITARKTGDLTFELELKKKDPVFKFRPTVSGSLCAPKEIFEKYYQMFQDGSKEQAKKGLRNDEELNVLSYTGNLGPYDKQKWEKSSQFVATPDDNYYMSTQDDVPKIWQEAPFFEKYIQRVVPEQASRLEALKNGEVDTASIPPNQAAAFKENKDVDVYIQPQPYVTPVMMNMRANGWLPFRQKEVRQGFMMGIDKATFVKNVWRGYAKAAYTMQPQWSEWYPPEEAIADYKFGSEGMFGGEMARKRIKEGLSKGDYSVSYDGDTLINENGNQVQLGLIAQAGQPIEKTVAEELARQWGERLGIKFKVQQIKGSTFVRQYAQPSVPEGKKDQVPEDWSGGPFNPGPRDVATSQKAWDLSLIYGFNTYPLTPSDSDVFFYEQGSVNYYGYVPSEGVSIKDKYDQASTTVDQQKRQELFNQVFKLIAQEQPFGFIAMEDSISGYNDAVVGPTESFYSGWNSNVWYKDKDAQ